MNQPREKSYRKVLGLCPAVCLAFALGFPASVKAQVQTTSAIAGTVTDSSHAVVPGVSVTVRNQGTGAAQATTTNASGFYSFPSLAPGIYTVTFTHSGFRTAEVTNRTIQAAQPAEVDTVLQLGEAIQTVTVSGAGAELLSTSTAAISGSVTPTLVQNLPLNGRDFFSLTTLVPGVTPQQLSWGGTSLGASSLNFVQPKSAASPVASGAFVSGNRDVSLNTSIDGSSTQSPIYNQTVQLQSPDTIQELRVETANMNAEFGNGFSFVSVITKSGTNAFHGDLYEFLRNSKLDATPFFTNQANQKLPGYRVNQFGFSLGGPIKKNKLQFFGNYEGYRLSEADFDEEPVPDMALRNGDFSNYHPVLPNLTLGPTPIIYNPYQFNPTTGLRTPFPNNQIPLGPTTLCAPRPTCVDPAALAFLQKWVLPPNAVIDGTPYVTGDAQTWIDRDQGTARLDWDKSSRANLYGRWTDFKTDNLAGGIQPLEGTESPYQEQNAVAHWTESISSKTVNDFMISFARPQWDYERNNAVPDVASQIGVKNTSANPGGPVFSLAEFTMDPSTVYAWTTAANKYQLKDDLRAVMGNHDLSFGGEVINTRFVYHNNAADKGEFYFEPQFSAACPAGNTTCASAMTAAGLTAGGFDYADYLLGGFEEQFLQNSSAPYAAHGTYFGLYAQDAWQVTPKLTLNYGLRYEYWTPWLVPRNTTAGFNFQTGLIQYALQNPLDYLDSQYCYGACAPLNPNTNRSSYTTGTNDFSPRVGIAYQLTPNTVVRSSFGVYYDNNINMVFWSQSQSGVAPFFLRVEDYQEPNTQVPTLLTSQAFPAAGPAGVPTPFQSPPATFRYVANHYPTQGMSQWSFSFQRRLGSSWSLETNYIGSHGIHLLQYINSNAPGLPQGALADESEQDRRPFPGWGTIGTWLPIGWGKYDAFIASVKNTPWHGLSLVANFSWAKDLVSSDAALSDQGNVNFQYPYIWAGPADFTPAKYFVAGYSYDLPFGQGKRLASSLNPVLNKFVSGWAFNGIATFSTGSPMPVTGPDLTGGSNESGSAFLDELAGCNPNNVPGGRGRTEWFNTACFSSPPFGVFGDSTIGSITQPGINNWDLTLSKTTRMGFPKESGRLEFRAEFFNAFNHTQWGNPTGSGPTSVNPQFGWIFSTRPPRQVQFVLKYIF